MWLGLQTVSSLERCPLFRVPFIGRFHCIWCSACFCLYLAFLQNVSGLRFFDFVSQQAFFMKNAQVFVQAEHELRQTVTRTTWHVIATAEQTRQWDPRCSACSRLAGSVLSSSQSSARNRQCVEFEVSNSVRPGHAAPRNQACCTVSTVTVDLVWACMSQWSVERVNIWKHFLFPYLIMTLGDSHRVSHNSIPSSHMHPCAESHSTFWLIYHAQKRI